MSETAEPLPAVCIYDNPQTWRREVWRDGQRVASFCWTLFDQADIAKRIPFYCPPDPFNPGQLWGDESAMTTNSNPAGNPGPWWKRKNLVAMLAAADSEPKGGTP